MKKIVYEQVAYGLPRVGDLYGVDYEYDFRISKSTIDFQTSMYPIFRKIEIKEGDTLFAAGFPLDVDVTEKVESPPRAISLDKYTRWFDIDLAKKTFASCALPLDLKQGFQKTLCKWELIILGYLPLAGISTCGLCNLFIDDSHQVSCYYCPIKKKTGRALCAETPFQSWGNGHSHTDAVREYDFLLGLYREHFPHEDLDDTCIKMEEEPTWNNLDEWNW